MNNQWEKTPEELQNELNQKSNSETQKQSLLLGELLKVVAKTIQENKEVKVENIGREVLNKISINKPEWLKETNLTPIVKKLDYIASAVIRKEVVKEIGIKRPDWLKELIPKEIEFPEPKEAEKLSPILEEVIKAIKEIEKTKTVEISNAIEIKEPKWFKFPDFNAPILSLSKFLVGLQKKVFTVKGKVEISNPVKEVTVLNPQKEIKITNLKDLEKDVKLMTAQLQALGNTGSNGGGSDIDTSPLAKEANQDPLAKYKFADLDDDASPNYYGATDSEGNWYILKEDTSAKTLRYATGDEDYATNWTGRVGLSYGYLFDVTIY